MTATVRVEPISEPLDSSKTLFELLGGEPAIRALVDHFYDLMDMEPDFTVLRGVHGPSLDQARDKLFWFLCGYFGGPNHYIERFGHPRLRARHLPFLHRRSRARPVGGLHGPRHAGSGCTSGAVRAHPAFVLRHGRLDAE